MPKNALISYPENPDPGVNAFVTNPLVDGNIDLSTRPIVKNKDGSYSTVRSMSFGTDQGEVLVPTVSDDGRIMSERQAMEQFYKTGRHLGIFATPDAATSYAIQLHNQQAADYGQRAKNALLK